MLTKNCEKKKSELKNHCNINCKMKLTGLRIVVRVILRFDNLVWQISSTVSHRHALLLPEVSDFHWSTEDLSPVGYDSVWIDKQLPALKRILIHVSEDTESKILSYLPTTHCRMLEHLKFFAVRYFSQLTAIW